MKPEDKKQATLAKALPAGQIATRKWLLVKGFTGHTLDNYVKSQRLRVLAKGVYAQPYALLNWQSLASSLSRLSEQCVHVGGLTALAQQGFSQYISESRRQTVHFYSSINPPGWFGVLAGQVPNTQFIWYGTRRLWRDDFARAFALNDMIWRDDSPPLIVSAPERAFLELLMTVPEHISFEHADELMQGLTQLSPRKLTTLLTFLESQATGPADEQNSTIDENT